MPVETGAGKIRILTGTPWCRPIPEASTGRCSVVSKRKIVLPYHSIPISTANISKFNYLMDKELSSFRCG
jgi:hypothetical protein